MNSGSCANCGEPLPPWSRADRRTCSVRCRVARQRRTGAANSRPAVIETGPASEGTNPGIAAVTPVSAGQEPGGDLVPVTYEGVSLRLALWLAEVSAEA